MVAVMVFNVVISVKCFVQTIIKKNINNDVNIKNSNNDNDN